MKRTCRKRKKAFIGAIIGAVTSIAGSAIGAAAQKKAQNKQIARENEINRNQSANNLSNSYSNEEYVNDFLNKTTFKYGGNKTMACGNRKTAEMGISERYKKQLEQREKDRKAANAIAEQKRREANARRVSAQRERAKYMTKLDAEAKKRQETKKRLSAKNTKPFPYNSPFVKNYTNESYNTPNYTPSNPVRITTNTQKSVTKSTSFTNRATTTSTKRPTSPVTQTRTAVKRNTNTSTQRLAKSTIQKTTKPSNAKTKINNTTTAKTTTQPARQNADNKLTFSRAFANARKAGKATFNWNGKSYTTQLAGEKKNNTSEKTYNATKLANNRLMDAKENTKSLINTNTKTNTIPSASSVILKSNTLNIADNNGYYDRIKMMKCGGKRKMKCGGKCKKK